MPKMSKAAPKVLGGSKGSNARAGVGRKGAVSLAVDEDGDTFFDSAGAIMSSSSPAQSFDGALPLASSAVLSPIDSVPGFGSSFPELSTAASLESKADALQGSYEKLLQAVQQSSAATQKAHEPLKGKIMALEALMNALQAENTLLKAQLADEGPIPVNAVKASAVFQQLEQTLKQEREYAASVTAQLQSAQATNARLQEQPVNLAASPSSSRLLTFFGALTAMDVRLQGSSSGSSDPSCLTGSSFALSTREVGSGGAVGFTLEIFEDEVVMVEYTPGEGCAEHLPEWMHASLQFGIEQAPMFLAKVTESLRHMRCDGTAEENGNVPEGEANSLQVQAQAHQEKEPLEQPISPLVEGVSALPSGSPTIVFNPRSSTKKSVSSRNACTPEGMDNRPMGMDMDTMEGLVTGAGHMAGVTPAAVRTSALGLDPAHVGLPTPAGVVAGSWAPSNTPAPTPLGALVDADMSTAVGAAPSAPAPMSSFTRSMGMAEGIAAAAEAAEAVDRLSRVWTVSRAQRHTRAASRARTVAPGPGSASKAGAGRRSIGHVVASDGLMYTTSPTPSAQSRDGRVTVAR